MPVTEIERRELVNRLVAAIGEDSTETLMQCLLTDGRDHLATKDDLKAFATKDDLKEALKAFATKDDLKAFATKDDLKAYATKEDLNNLRLENQAEFARLRGHFDLAMGKQMRMFSVLLIGVMLTIWGSLVVYAVS